VVGWFFYGDACERLYRGRVCLYGLFIRFVYTGGWVVKVFKGFRFDSELYAGFKRVACAGGCTVTGAFERFMSCCVEGGGLVFPDRGTEGFEAEARVLVDWLGKGRRFYRGEGGVEVNISGRLVWLLPKVRDAKLRGELEETLKGSVSEQE
jgi:hypothetical protein